MKFEVAMECRLCLSSSPTNWIFSFNSVIVQNILSILKISTNDGLPEHICSDCVNKLNEIEDFVKKCEENNEYLRRSVEMKSIKQETLDIEMHSEYQINKNDCQFDKELVVVIHDNVDELLKQMKCQKMNKRNAEINSKISEDADTKFICEICQDKFSDDGEFQDHLKEHIEKEFCMCGFCFERFRFENELEEHYIKKHECSYCHTLVKRKRSHERRHHNKKLQAYECTICGKVSRKLRHHEKHMKSEHSIFICDVCNKMCTTKYNIISHMKKHFPITAIECKECKKIYKTRSSYTAHMKHFHWMTKLRIRCEVCNKYFTTKEKLNEHILLHNGQKMYKCNHCYRHYYSKLTLLKHIRRSHNNVKTAYNCRTCDESFRTARYLRNHEAVHSSSVPYRCTVCPRGFLLKPSLWCHLQMMHKDLDSATLMKEIIENRDKEL